MLVRRRAFLGACLAVVGGGSRAVYAGPLINRAASGAGAGAAAGHALAQALNIVVYQFIGGILFVVPIVLISELIEWLNDNAPLSNEARHALLTFRHEMIVELKPLLDAAAEERGDKMIDELVRLEAKYGPKVRALLDQPLEDRFEQLRLQLQGAVGMVEAGVAEQLQLNADQRSRLQKLADAQQATTLQAAEKSVERPLLQLARLVAIKRGLDVRGTELLTETQRVAWRKLTGDPVKLPF